ELKKQLLAEATADAVARAQEISGSAKTRLGKMREARAGVFQITEPYSTDVSDYGIYNTSTRQKSISVTLTAVFGLR
ncbi:MAG TPA: SIMPL domain-containing protein, partial [Candidatus Cloacimonadota bacterium]|nr:SIMPL domain-containing protein [Candidatus Cloacimonadota bacterium]